MYTVATVHGKKAFQDKFGPDVKYLPICPEKKFNSKSP